MKDAIGGIADEVDERTKNWGGLIFALTVVLIACGVIHWACQYLKTGRA